MTDDSQANPPLYFRASRQGASHYPSWAKYRMAVFGGNVAKAEDAALWDVLEARAIRKELIGGAARRNPSRVIAQSIPWITFVLGSGCLSAADAPPGATASDDARSRLLESLAEIKSAFPELEFPELDLKGSAMKFLELLVVQKTGLGSVEDAFAAVKVREDIAPRAYSALVILAAALATQFYGAALDASQHVLQRPDREEVRLERTSSKFSAVDTEIVIPLRRMLDRVAAAGSRETDPPQRKALAGLALAVNSAIAELKMRRLHVELLTSFAWYFFTAGTRVYPSWSELMLLRSFDDDVWFTDEVLTSSDASPRPRIAEMLGQDSWVRKRIVEVTNESWKSREEGAGPSDRDGFYDLVAGFLEQQASAVLPSPDQLPYPACFVSSFDLELEMALWKKDNPYVVVLPVFAVEPEYKQDASLHWVFAVIDPKGKTNDEEDLLDWVDHPRDLPSGLWNPSEWHVLTVDDLRKAFAAHSNGNAGRLPIVVRLTGSPLMAVPHVRDLRPTPTTQALHHALLLDEYIAIQQASLDLSTVQSMEANNNLPRNRGLPPFLSESTGAGPSRFWMFFGTQLGDTGVRLRLTAQQLAYRTPQYQQFRRAQEEIPGADVAVADTTTPSGRTLGVVINTESQASDRELFLWQNFDVVDGRPLDLVSELRGLHNTISEKLAEAAKKSSPGRTGAGK